MKKNNLGLSEEQRRREFPVSSERVFMAHAAVAPLPRAAVDAIGAFLEQGSRDHQESGFIAEGVTRARKAAAALLGCLPSEIALLGPTSMGLNLVANGLDWKEGDEILYYGDDYPANVYPWTKLKERGVKPVALHPALPGRITWDLVESSLSPRTRLVALATCHYLSGIRIDAEGIGRRLRERGILYCLDAIQTLGAFPLSVEHVDFLSADSHKWLLGPLGAGIFYVREAAFPELRPTLLGSWNVQSPDFVAQEELNFYEGARRYEPGALNVPGILGMAGSMEMLMETGLVDVGRKILHLRKLILDEVIPLGYRTLAGREGALGEEDEEEMSGIITLRHPLQDAEEVFRRLQSRGVSVSLRRNREGEAFIRVSPHFYNTGEEVMRLVGALRAPGGDRRTTPSPGG